MTRRTTLPDQSPGRVKRGLLLVAAALLIGSGAVFLLDVLGELGEPFPVYRAEATGVVALAIGSWIVMAEYVRLYRRTRRIERELDVASGAFQEVIEEHFERWGLTVAERDVALLAIKGVPIAEIAAIRNTRDGTIKAQNAAIYRKAGVSGRAELIATFVEELTTGLRTDRAKA